MFGIGKKKDPQPQKELVIVATQNGTTVPLSEVPDEAFSQKMLGDGIAILPEDGVVVAPVGGELIDVPDTLHAYCIHTPEGLDVLVHIGIDTVALKGEGFRAFVKTGDRVKAGDKLAEVDIALLKQKNIPLYTPTLITNMDAVKSLDSKPGKTQAGSTVVAVYRI